MLKKQCLFAFVSLFVNVVHSWDLAVTVGDQIEFYTNGTKTGTEGVRFRDLTALAYDAVHNMLLFVDKQSDNASIFSYHLSTKQYQPLVRKRSYENIQGLAFDPVQRMLFWTDTNDRSIYWISLKPGFKNNAYGNSMIKMDDELPRAIAVDSCRGYIYWTNTNVTKPTIERARFDGSERTTIIDTKIYMPTSISIDQRTKRLYWADDKEGIHYSIESSDLEGKDRRTVLEGTHHQPNALTVSKDSLYWVDWGYKSVWHFPKQSPKEMEPTNLSSFNSEVPFGIVANYRIEDQIEGIEECKELKQLSQSKSVINNTFTIPRDMGIYCLHGFKVNGKSACKCSVGYSGERCEVSNCQNYCFNGDCSVSAAGQPLCKCNTGFTGPRCELDLCGGFCLNDGECTVTNKQPTCQCSNKFEGARCESRRIENKVEEPKLVYVNKPCNCSNEALLRGAQQELVTCDDGWDSVRDPVLMSLGVVSGLLCVACAYLITKVMQLKKRPRIKKRIIVNKNVTPLTARPDACEITIENCCNMNICETPCFEPRSTIRPTLLEAKPGKEEKKTLINNMEYPEDY